MKIALALPLLIMFTCSPGSPQKVAYDTIVGAKAFLDNEKAAHPECSSSTSTVCVDLAKATAAKDTLIDALEVYCASPAFSTGGGACTPAAGATTDKLTAAIAGYNQSAADLKAVIQ